jgi:hypothetical protein
LVAAAVAVAGTGAHTSVVHALPSLQSVFVTQGAHAVPSVAPVGTRQYGVAALQPVSTPDPDALSRQPMKIGATGGAQLPVPVRQIPEAQSVPTLHLGGAPSKQIQSDWMPVGLLELPPYATVPPRAPYSMTSGMGTATVMYQSGSPCMHGSVGAVATRSARA